MSAPARSCACCGGALAYLASVDTQASGATAGVLRDEYRCVPCDGPLARYPRDLDEISRVLDESEIGPGRTPAAHGCPTHAPCLKGPMRWPEYGSMPLADGSMLEARYQGIVGAPAYYERTHPDGRVWCGWRKEGKALPGPSVAHSACAAGNHVPWRGAVGTVGPSDCACGNPKAPATAPLAIPPCPCCGELMRPTLRPCYWPEADRCARCDTCGASWGWYTDKPNGPIPDGVKQDARRRCKAGGQHGAAPDGPNSPAPARACGCCDGPLTLIKADCDPVDDWPAVATGTATSVGCPRCATLAEVTPGREPRCKPCNAEHRYLKAKPEASDPAWIAAMRARHAARAAELSRLALLPEVPLWGAIARNDVPPPTHTGECVRGCRRTYGDTACMHERAR